MITTSDLQQLDSQDPKIKYGYAKELLQISTTQPELLYAHFDYWIQLMQASNNILKWTAIDIIGHLSAVDKENRISNVVTSLIQLLHGGNLITCNHAIFALGLIAYNKPEFKTMVFEEWVAIRQDDFNTEECSNIATGKILTALLPFVSEIKHNKMLLNFVKQATHNSRNATKKKAVALIKKIEKASSSL